MANLSRDVAHANQTLSPIFDLEKEQNRLQAVQMIGEIGSQVGDIARTEGQLRAIEAGKAELAKNGTKEPEAGASQDEWNRYNKSVENTESYKSTEQRYGTGSDLQRAITAATAAISGLASGNISSSVAGAAAPYIANEIGKYITPNSAIAGVMAHAVVNAALARSQGQNALVSATGAAAGEATGILLAQEIYGKRPEALTESERQTISALSTLTAGLAGGLAGNSTGSVVSGAQAGKTTVENNAMSGLVPSRVQQDASLAFDLGSKGVTDDEIIKAVDKSHIDPSLGDTAKIHGDVKGQVAGGYVASGYLEGVLSEDKFAINAGVTKVLGWRADASAGLTFGPYPIKYFNSTYDYSGAISAGIFSFEGSIGKDGIGGSFRVGGGIGASIRQSENSSNQPEINGSGSTELISWPIKKD
ncbi:polymorphic toxin type 25 domain-containing protein [Mangrovibacter sp. SLW1]